MPLLLGPDAVRLSKRHGAVSLAAFRAAGFSPARLRGRLAASLGWAEATEELSPSQWLARARFDGLGAADSIYDGPWPA